MSNVFDFHSAGIPVKYVSTTVNSDGSTDYVVRLTGQPVHFNLAEGNTAITADAEFTFHVPSGHELLNNGIVRPDNNYHVALWGDWFDDPALS